MRIRRRRPSCSFRPGPESFPPRVQVRRLRRPERRPGSVEISTLGRKDGWQLHSFEDSCRYEGRPASSLRRPEHSLRTANAHAIDRTRPAEALLLRRRGLYGGLGRHPHPTLVLCNYGWTSVSRPPANEGGMRTLGFQRKSAGGHGCWPGVDPKRRRNTWQQRPVSRGMPGLYERSPVGVVGEGSSCRTLPAMAVPNSSPRTVGTSTRWLRSESAEVAEPWPAGVASRAFGLLAMKRLSPRPDPTSLPPLLGANYIACR